MTDKKTNNISAGSSLTIFVALFMHWKMTGIVDWSWWMVFAPYWISCVILLVVFIIMIAYGVRKEIKSKKNSTDKLIKEILLNGKT